MNGLALPIFIKQFQDAPPEVIEQLRPILKYNSSLNHAFDYIYIGAVCFSMMSWSIRFISTRAFPAWLGWFGIILSVTATTMAFAGFIFTNLTGFRIFVFGYVAWTILTGIYLLKDSQYIEPKPAGNAVLAR